MDPARRGADRLARFYQSKRFDLPDDAVRGRAVRSFAEEAGTTSVRRLITGRVVAFVPPGLPLRHGTVACTNAVAAVHASGAFTLGVRAVSSHRDPVALIIGCCTNDARGAWTALVGALNFAADSLATSQGSIGVFHATGSSWWLARNFAGVAASGVTFRMVTAPPTASMRSLFETWVLQFGGQLVHRHLLALTDDHPEPSTQTLDPEATTSIDPEDAQLRLRGALIFE